jgi:hypothetical protein
MLDFSSVLAVTLAAVGKGADRDTAARAAYPVIYKAGVTLPELLREERAGEKVKLGVSAAYRALVAGMRSLLEHGGTDITDAQAVRHAIRDDVWLDEGHAVRLEHRKAKPATKTEPAIVALTDDEKREYDRIAKRISRLARDVVDAPKVAPQKVATPVKRTTKAAIKALAEAGITKAELLAAIADVYAK